MIKVDLIYFDWMPNEIVFFTETGTLLFFVYVLVEG